MSKITASFSFRYCCFLLLLITTKMACQENYTARWYTADNNELQQNSIKAIVQGKHNFIWMTTENGIVRYDGNNFLVFNSSNTSLEHTRFTDIFGSIEKDSLTSYNESKKELVFIRNAKVQILKKMLQNLVWYVTEDISSFMTVFRPTILLINMSLITFDYLMEIYFL